MSILAFPPCLAFWETYSSKIVPCSVLKAEFATKSKAKHNTDTQFYNKAYQIFTKIVNCSLRVYANTHPVNICILNCEHFFKEWTLGFIEHNEWPSFSHLHPQEWDFLHSVCFVYIGMEANLCWFCRTHVCSSISGRMCCYSRLQLERHQVSS